MPRLAVRRKADPIEVDNNNKGENEAPKSKMQRLSFQLPLPQRPRVVGRALVCGQGDMGQLGLGDDESKFERKRPALLDKITNVVDVKAGGMHNLVLTHDGRVYSFGCNDEGALGRDSSEEGSEFEPRPIDLPGKVLKISAGDSHSACLLEDGRVFAWGSFRDSHGNMGLTLEGNKRLPIDVLPGLTCCDIASGADHLVILTCQGKVYTVGCAEQGQLGRVSLRSASGEGRRGKTELLRPGLVIVKRGKPIEAIWATNYCTFLRESQTGNIWAFGLNNYKQLAYAKDMSTIINPINTKFENIKQIAGGQHHTLVLKEDGSVFVIGRKDYGRLGLGSVPEDVTDLQPIAALKGKKIVSVSCGEAQSFALTDDGKLYSWGMGSNHQLGTGSEDDALEPVLIVSKQTEGKRIIRAASGGQHSIFLVEDENQPAFEEVKEKETEKEKPAAKQDKKKPTKEASTKKVVETEKVDEDNAADDAKAKTNGDKIPEEDAKSNATDDDKKEEDSKASEAAPPPAKRGRKKK
ncbi:Regulator of chromosome condensation [Lucilia cuprina]|uniref:Regulator of chromosome condensation n=1 Tax=Lucilia cuprina TaxID=7375 RepID=A0A0L0CQ00_LUCCU|nr:regulator of chromosome condensation [Lucilia cuprina]XP_046807702.1 regulator of chromosome condensation [Lucilia cuprina]KAI8121407.1 Regulator of chromosome condensation [Lucilia cuprina]KNC34341.1 Regulator of chromosome condensation [Lucilia cuprina]